MGTEGRPQMAQISQNRFCMGNLLRANPRLRTQDSGLKTQDLGLKTPSKGRTCAFGRTVRGFLECKCCGGWGLAEQKEDTKLQKRAARCAPCGRAKDGLRTAANPEIGVPEARPRAARTCRSGRGLTSASNSKIARTRHP
jgi:hypothetical protein